MKLLAVLAAILTAACVFGLVAMFLPSVGRRTRPLPLDEVLKDRKKSVIFFLAISLALSSAVSWSLMALLTPASIVLAINVPKLLEKRRRQEIRIACESQLDTLADIVAMGVRAGLSFDSAVSLYCEKFQNELSRQLGAAHLRWSTGICTRDDALEDLARSVGSDSMERFAQTVSHAIRHGSPLADMLVRLAADLRNERRSLVERQVAKAPVKMLIPTGIFILPAMLLLVMGPVLIQFLETGM